MLYICPAGKPTIGWGHIEGVELGTTITQKEADKLFLDDLVIYENAVNRLVKVDLNQDMFDALVSFEYNSGGLRGSTLLRMLNEGKYSEASDQFDRWIYVTNPQTKKKIVSNGLVRRRKEEQKLFRSGNEH